MKRKQTLIFTSKVILFCLLFLLLLPYPYISLVGAILIGCIILFYRRSEGTAIAVLCGIVSIMYATTRVAPTSSETDGYGMSLNTYETLKIINYCISGFLLAIVAPPVSISELFNLEDSFFKQILYRNRTPSIVVTIFKIAFAIIFYSVIAQFGTQWNYISVIVICIVTLAVCHTKNTLQLISIGLLSVVASFPYHNILAVYYSERRASPYIHESIESLFSFFMITGGVLIAIASPPFSLKDQFPQYKKQDRVEKSSSSA